LGICGGIAAYKSAELVRLLRKQGVDVRVVMTRSATQFIAPLTFQALSGHPVQTDLVDTEQENAMGHINLARWAELFIIAPATANMIAKFSLGLADDLLSTLYLATRCPVYIAPAMNQAMWQKPVVQEHIQRLKNQQVAILGPDTGIQACGETGPGRMLEVPAICEYLLTASTFLEVFNGIKILISAGPTREAIDPVRYLSNRSSGKMGYALAHAAQIMGAQVTLVSGPCALTAPGNIDRVNVETAEQMYHAILKRAAAQDIFIAAAAVADYRPAAVEAEKIKKGDQESVLKLIKTKDILAAVTQLPAPPFSVGFAAETHNLEQYAHAKLADKNLDMIAANWVGREHGGFDSEQNALQIYWRGGQHSIAMADKHEVARQLLHLIAERFNEKRTA